MTGVGYAFDNILKTIPLIRIFLSVYMTWNVDVFDTETDKIIRINGEFMEFKSQIIRLLSAEEKEITKKYTILGILLVSLCR